MQEKEAEKGSPLSQWKFSAPVTPDEHWANQNLVFQRATQHQPEASDPTQMKSSPVYKGQSIHSPYPTQPPIPATNRNSAFPFGLERCEFPGLYKPALPDLRQDLTAGPFRVNNSGSSLSSPSHLHPSTKPFSGRPARPYMSYTRGWGSFEREAWDCLPAVAARPTPRHQRRHRSRSARSCCCRTPSLPPTVVDIGTTSQLQPAPSTRRRASRKPSRKRRCNRSMGVFRPPKCSPPHGHWWE